MSKVSKELLEFKKMIEEEDLEFYANEEIEKLNLDFLIDYMYENEFILDDSRNLGYTLHSLEEILLIVIFALLANCNTFKEIELFMDIHYEWLQNKLKLYNVIPSISTVRRIISIINPIELESLCNDVFFKYIKNSNNIYEKEELIITDILSLDGKTANEIPTGPKSLKRLNIKDSIITFDALNTQEKTIRYIKEKEAHYVAPIKDNHKDFCEELKTYFKDTGFLKECDKYTTTEKAHNQLERREYYFTNDVN